MKHVIIYYGSSTGATESVAGRIAQKLNIDKGAVRNVTAINKDDVNDAEVLLLGTSTWGAGDLQDDWYDGIKLLKSTDLSGKVIALFGCGDSQSFSDTFCGALGVLYNELKDSGAKFVGAVSASDYDFSDSESVVDGNFVGLALDEANEDDKTDRRIDSWINEIENYIS